MTATILTAISGIFLLFGALVALVSAIGLLRLPDIFTRMHAASKAGIAGSGIILIGVALHAQDISVWIKCLAALMFFMLTAPVSAHLLARAALSAGSKPEYLDK